MARTRATKVTLIAEVNQYLDGMAKAGKATRDTGSEAEKLAQKGQAFTLIGQSALAMGSIAAAGVGLAVKKFADFDQAMSNVQAATHESAENMGLLREAALEAGASTVYSATEAAGAIEELAKAGVSTTDILAGGLDGALDLAAAGNLEVAEAAEIAASALTQFQLKGTDVTHVADLLAAGAGKAQGSVQDLSGALNQSGLVASQMGLSIEETVGGLSAFASAGLVGSDAGTSFRSMLLALNPKSKEAGTLMSDLGFSAYDSQGDFIGLAAVADELRGSLAGMSAEQRTATLNTIFGQDAIRAASVIYQQGGEGIQSWIDRTNDSGYAAETAAIRLDNLAGDVEALGGAFDTALIQSGSGANDMLRTLVQSATEAVDAFGSMPVPLQQATLGVGAVGAAVSLALGGFLTAVPKVAEFNTALDTMGPRAQKAGRAAVGLSKGLGAIAAVGAAVMVLDQIASAGEDAALSMEKTTEVILKSGTALEAADRIFESASGDVRDLSSAFELLLGGSLNSNLERFGSTINVFGLSDQVRDTRTQFETLGESLADLVNRGEGKRAAEMFAELNAAAQEQGFSTEQLMALLPAYSDALAGVSNEQELAADTTDKNAEALAELEGAAADTGEQVDKLADQIRGFGSAELDARSAAREFEAAIDDLEESVRNNGTTLDTTTEKGRANEAALDAIAQAAKETAAATLEQTGSQDLATAAVQRGREELIRSLEQFGISGAEAEAYADKLGLIPSNIGTAASITNFEQAMEQARQVADAINRIPGRRDVVINQVVEETGAARGAVGSAYSSANGNLFSYADGGFASGIYAGRPGSIHKFAEPETRWEAYISGKPGQEARNLAIAAEAMQRLGGPDWGASGARVSPTPTGPRGPLISGLSLTVRDDGAALRHVERMARDALDEYATRIEV